MQEEWGCGVLTSYAEIVSRETANRRIKTKPLPTWLITEIALPWAPAITFTMGSPSPVPPESFARAQFGR